MAKNDFMSIEVSFLHDQEVKRYVMRNKSWDDVQSFREIIISSGLMIPAYIIDPGGGWSISTWFVIVPWNLKSITITKQDKYFKE